MRRLLVIICSIVLSSATTWAYTPPIGIPDPSLSWGGIQNPVDDSPPARPAPWTSEVAGYYYIDYGTGSDSGRTYGSPTAPRKTIPRPVPAGSYVELHGTYSYVSGGKVFFQGNGTSGRWSANATGPVWIVGQTGSEPTITGAALVYGSYVYLYNLKFSGTTLGPVLQVSSTSAGYAADHIAIRNCDVQGTSTSADGVAVVANSGSHVTQMLIYNNRVRNHGPTYDVDQDSHMIDIASYVDNIWILNNALDNSSGAGIQLGPYAPGPTFVYIGKNLVNNSRQSGIGTKYATDVIVSENIVHDVQDRCVGADTSPSKGLHAQYSPNRLWWINNNVYNCRYGIRVASTNSGQGEVYAIGNIIHNIDIPPSVCFGYPTGTNTWDMAAIHFHGAVTKWAVNNTIYNVSSGIHDSSTTSGGNFYNNIISRVTHVNGYALYTETTTNTQVDYSLYDDIAGSMFRWGGGGTKYTTLAGFSSGTGKNTHSITGNPLFTNAAGNIFSLTPSSPAIDHGTVASIYQTFLSRYGISISKDNSNTAKPQGVALDIGAYEFNGAVNKPIYPLIKGIN